MLCFKYNVTHVIILGDSEEVLFLCVGMKLKLNCSHSERAAFVSTSLCLLEVLLLSFLNSKATCRSKAPDRSWEIVTTVYRRIEWVRWLLKIRVLRKKGCASFSPAFITEMSFLLIFTMSVEHLK